MTLDHLQLLDQSYNMYMMGQGSSINLYYKVTLTTLTFNYYI